MRSPIVSSPVRLRIPMEKGAGVGVGTIVEVGVMVGLGVGEGPRVGRAVGNPSGTGKRLLRGESWSAGGMNEFPKPGHAGNLPPNGRFVSLKIALKYGAADPTLVSPVIVRG